MRSILRPPYDVGGGSVSRPTLLLGGSIGYPVVVRSGADIHNEDFVTGTSGWIIYADGTVEFNTGTFRGSLIAGDIHIPADQPAAGWHVDSSGNMWWGAHASYAAASIKISVAGEIDFTTGTFGGTLEAGDVHIPDQTTAASFHVDSDGDVWVGTNVANKATAPFSIDSATGAVTFGLADDYSLILSTAVDFSGTTAPGIFFEGSGINDAGGTLVYDRSVGRRLMMRSRNATGSSAQMWVLSGASGDDLQAEIKASPSTGTDRSGTINLQTSSAGTGAGSIKLQAGSNANDYVDIVDGVLRFGSAADKITHSGTYWSFDSNSSEIVRFNDSGSITFGSSDDGLTAVTGDRGSVQTVGSGAGGWEGYSIGGHAAFISSSSTGDYGLYDDQNNEWGLLFNRNGKALIYYNGTAVAETTNQGWELNVDGAKATPSLRYASNTDVGMYYLANVVAFAANGTCSAQFASNRSYFQATGTASGTAARLLTQTVNSESMKGLYFDTSKAAHKSGMESWSLSDEQFGRIDIMSYLVDDGYVSADGSHRGPDIEGDDEDGWRTLPNPPGAQLIRRGGFIYENLLSVDLHLVTDEAPDEKAIAAATIGKVQELIGRVATLEAAAA